MSTEVEMLDFFFGKKHGILTEEQVSTLRPTMTAALERTAYRRFEVVKELSRMKVTQHSIRIIFCYWYKNLIEVLLSLNQRTPVVVRIECWTDLWYRLISSVYQLLKYKILRSPTLVGIFSARSPACRPKIKKAGEQGRDVPLRLKRFY